MKDRDLFNEDLDLDAEVKKLRRNVHPPTSHAGAEYIVRSRALGELQEWVLGIVRHSPGSTASELASQWAVRDPRKIGRRLVEIERKDKIIRGDVRNCKITGRPACTWWPVKKEV